MNRLDMTEIGQDIRYALRRLRQAPGFACAVIVILAVGIGGTSAMFSVVDALALRPLPYKDADRLVWVSNVSNEINFVPGPHFLEWRKNAKLLASIAAFNSGNPTLSGVGEAERLRSLSVSSGFFFTLDAHLRMGRTFTPAEDLEGPSPVAILSAALWKRKFDRDPSVIGGPVQLDGKTYTVVGVLQDDFHFIQPVDVLLPLALPEQSGANGIAGLSIIGRLAAGTTPAQVEAELQTLAAGMQARYGFLGSGVVRVTSLREKLVAGSRRLSIILLAATGMILLIGCANAANLLLSRSLRRRKSVAIQMALGAGRSRLAREAVAEGLLLSLTAGGLGTVLALAIIQAIARWAPTSLIGTISQVGTMQVNLHVLAFTLAVSLLTGLIFGVIPVVSFTEAAVETVLRDRSRAFAPRMRLQQVLMAVEIAISLVLLISSGLLLRGFIKVLDVPPGYDAAHLLTVGVNLQNASYPNRAPRLAFFGTLLDRISAMPGVQSDATVTYLPLTALNLRVWPHIAEKPGATAPQGPATPITAVSPEYFRTMGIPLKQGRMFDSRDQSTSPAVLILSESVAKTLFGGENALGRQVWLPWQKQDLPVVVGIALDVRSAGPEQPVTPQIYIPYTQNPMFDVFGANTIVVRTSGDPEALVPAVRDAVRALDKDLAIYDVQTMARRVDTVIAPRRFTLLLLGGFAIAAAVLATAGVYSVVAYVVSQRKQEIGIRLALGAQESDILGLFLREEILWVFGGLAAGLAIALAVTRLMSSLLFEVRPSDGMTFAAASLVLIIVTAAACYIPAHSAARTDPTIALKTES